MPAAAARSGLVVVISPSGYRLTGKLKGFKPVLLQAYVFEGSIEVVGVGVLRWAARLNQDVLDAVLLCPSHDCRASALRRVVSPNRLGVTPKCGCSIQQSCHVMPANAKVGRDVHTFAREVVCYRQALDAPGDDARPANGITDEVHASQV